MSAADADGPRSAALITLLALNGVVRGSAWPAKVLDVAERRARRQG